MSSISFWGLAYLVEVWYWLVLPGISFLSWLRQGYDKDMTNRRKIWSMYSYGRHMTSIWQKRGDLLTDTEFQMSKQQTLFALFDPKSNYLIIIWVFWNRSVLFDNYLILIFCNYLIINFLNYLKSIICNYLISIWIIWIILSIVINVIIIILQISISAIARGGARRRTQLPGISVQRCVHVPSFSASATLYVFGRVRTRSKLAPRFRCFRKLNLNNEVRLTTA